MAANRFHYGTTIFLVALAVLLMQTTCKPRTSTELSDGSFEHDTQASTGGTTGDWFVNFCKRSIKNCRNIEPMWNEITEELFGRVTIAHVYL